MRHLIRRLRIPTLHFELGIVAVGAILAGLAIWFFDALPYLVNWLWFIAGAFFGMVILCLLVAFFAFGARGDLPEDADPREQPRPKPRLVRNGKPNGK